MRAKLLTRYIAKSVLSAIFLITLMLSGLQIFILFVNQLDDLGKVNYNIATAALFVLMQVPYQVYLFFPVASLLGSLIGLGIMANHRELVVMRAAGMSIWQVTMAVLKAAFIAIMLVTVIGETVVPKLAFFANDLKLQALSGGQALRTSKGIWLRNDHDFINIGLVLPGDVLQNVNQFRFDAEHHLRVERKLDEIQFHDGHWEAFGVFESIIHGDHVTARHLDKMDWDVPLRTNILRVSSSEPDEMTLHELNQYLRVQKMNHQSAHNYQLAFWQRIIQPITTVVMMMLAIPFIFGPLRSSTMGSKLMAGAAIGFSFHMINRIFGPISQVLQWPVEVAAFVPTILFALLGMYLMRRVK